MLLHNRELFQPIKKTEEIQDEMFQKYIDIRDKQYNLMPTTFEIIEEVRKKFFNSHPDVPKERLMQMWEFMRNPIQMNEALARFVLDFGGAESDFFFPWLIAVAHSPSEALELSYNAGRNLTGEWFDNIPADDKIEYFVKNLPTLAYNRERQLTVADLVMTDREITSVGEKSVVLDLGAGRMAWARHHGFKFKSRLQSVWACDLDKNIHPERLFNSSLAELGITYEQANILTELTELADASVSLAILQGVASYYPMDVFRERIMRPLYHGLRDGGHFFFDLQLNHISYEWSVKVFSWPEMKLPASAAEAIDKVEQLRKQLWSNGMKFQAEYILDTYNATPLSVMIVFTKI